jgi:hypothetical protein
MSTAPSAFTVCKGITHAAIVNPFGIFVNYNTVTSCGLLHCVPLMKRCILALSLQCLCFPFVARSKLRYFPKLHQLSGLYNEVFVLCGSNFHISQLNYF